MRKTKTSSAVKDRYNNKVYDNVSFRAPKELVAEFKQKCKENGTSQAQIFKNAMQEYLKNN